MVEAQNFERKKGMNLCVFEWKYKKGLDYFFIPITYNIHVVINFFSETDRRRLKYIAYSLQEDLLIEKKYTHK